MFSTRGLVNENRSRIGVRLSKREVRSREKGLKLGKRKRRKEEEKGNHCIEQEQDKRMDGFYLNC